METNEDLVVVPLVPTESTLTTEGMLRMILSREAVLLKPSTTPQPGEASGLTAHAVGAFAKAISGAVGRGAAQTPTGAFQVILPAGATMRDLVPAVGGGFRGLVKGSGSTAIAGHVRLIPAVAGAGATVAAGPLIATVGLAVAAEMLAQHQTNKKLESIKGAVQGIQRHLEAEDRAIIVTADQAAKKVAGYLLDQANMPAIAGASHSFADLSSLANRHIEQLDDWRQVVADRNTATRSHGGDLLTALVGKRDDQIGVFERAVAQTYESIALRARIVVLEKVASEASNPDRSLPHVAQLLRAELAGLADRQAQLTAVLDDLSAMNIDSSKLPVAMAGKGVIGARTSFGRMARALHAAPPALPFLTDTDQMVMELNSTPTGMAVMTPTAS